MEAGHTGDYSLDGAGNALRAAAGLLFVFSGGVSECLQVCDLPVEVFKKALFVLSRGLHLQ